MPGVATSFAQAGQDTLEQALKQRLLEQQMQQSQLQMLAQIDQRDQMNAFRMDSAMRADESLRHRQSQDAMTRERQARLDAEKAAETAGKKREARNAAGSAEMVFEGLSRGANPDDPGMLRARFDGKVPVGLMPKPKEPSLQEQGDAAEELAFRRARGSKRGNPGDGPKATKVAKDTPGAPRQFRDTIANRVGTPGFETADAAIKSVQARWQVWRQSYPGLDLNQVRTVMQNLYGQRVSQGGTDAIAAAVLDAIKNDIDE